MLIPFAVSFAVGTFFGRRTVTKLTPLISIPINIDINFIR